MTKSVNAEKMTKLLSELLRNSERSDRELAKVLDVSQPTVSRMKRRLVHDKMIMGYSVIPNFYKMGYKILALNFVNSKHNFSSKENREEMIKEVKSWMMDKPNVVYCDSCRGMGMDGGFISFHKSYEEFDEFIRQHNLELGKYLDGAHTVLFNLGRHDVIKPFHFKYLL